MNGEIAYFYSELSKMPKPTRCENSKCHIYSNGQCIGGTAFTIKNKWFCSPRCGNEYWGLKKGDEHYWPNSEDGDSESDDENSDYD